MIRIKTKYDLEAYRSFNKYASYKLFWLAYICGILLLLAGIFLAFTSRNGFSVYLLSAALLPTSMHMYYKTKELEAIKSPLIKNQTYQIFEFNDSGFSFEQISNGNNLKDKYLYNEIYSIIKYKQYYFIYINRSQAFIIKNEDYILGDEAELDDILKENIGVRFILKGNHKRKKVLKP